MFSAVVCVDMYDGIGMKDGTIPFRNAEDMRNFVKLTTGGAVIMGRKTFEAIGRPLKNRINIIISRRGYECLFATWKDITIGDCIEDYKRANNAELIVYKSAEECVLELSGDKWKAVNKFVIGGAEIYKYFISHRLVRTIYMTRVNADFGCEVDIKDIASPLYGNFRQNRNNEYIETAMIIKAADTFNHWSYDVLEYINKEEEAVLTLIGDVLDRGSLRKDRTGVGAKSLFGHFLEFNLIDSFPLGTTKKINLRGVFEELMWFLRGQTDANILSDKGIKIWNPNTTREFLDARGLTYPVGDIGPTYGFNFRHFGAVYTGAASVYKGQGCDQLSEIIHLIKNDPFSRRMIINLWNPAVLDQCALPPCLFNYQFYVEEDKDGIKWLSCLMTQRSSDISLAGFWNIATGALLVYMMARICGCRPHTLKWSIGDAHIYQNQFNEVRELLTRKPRPFPKLLFRDSAPAFSANATGTPAAPGITDFSFDDLLLVNYNPLPSIKSVLNA